MQNVFWIELLSYSRVFQMVSHGYEFKLVSYDQIFLKKKKNRQE